jgi:hypothetical protein
MEAIIASEQEPMPMEGIIQGSSSTIATDSDSELSIVSISRFSSLEENWWKEKAATETGTATAIATGVDNIEASAATATVTAMRTRSKGKRVH